MRRRGGLVLALSSDLLGGWLAAPAIGAAAELSVYSAGAMEAGLGPLIEAFRRESGHAVRLTVAVPNLLRQRVEAGETPDVLIAPVPVMEALARAGALRDAPRETVGKVGVAVVVRAGARVPDVATPEALRQALLDCESLVFNRASTGTYFERVLDAPGHRRGGVREDHALSRRRHGDGARDPRPGLRDRHRARDRDPPLRGEGDPARGAAARAHPELHDLRGGRPHEERGARSRRRPSSATSPRPASRAVFAATGVE